MVGSHSHEGFVGKAKQGDGEYVHDEEYVALGLRVEDTIAGTILERDEDGPLIDKAERVRFATQEVHVNTATAYRIDHWAVRQPGLLVEGRGTMPSSYTNVIKALYPAAMQEAREAGYAKAATFGHLGGDGRGNKKS